MDYYVTVQIKVNAESRDDAAGAAYREIIHNYGNGIDWVVRRADGSDILTHTDADVSFRLG